MNIRRMCRTLASIAILACFSALPAQAEVLGPSPYASFTDSPFQPELGFAQAPSCTCRTFADADHGVQGDRMHAMRGSLGALTAVLLILASAVAAAGPPVFVIHDLDRQRP